MHADHVCVASKLVGRDLYTLPNCYMDILPFDVALRVQRSAVSTNSLFVTLIYFGNP